MQFISFGKVLVCTLLHLNLFSCGRFRFVLCLVPVLLCCFVLVYALVVYFGMQYCRRCSMLFLPLRFRCVVCCVRFFGFVVLRDVLVSCLVLCLILMYFFMIDNVYCWCFRLCYAIAR